MKTASKSISGYYLVQSLVCVAIVGTLSSVAVPTCLDSMTLARGKAESASIMQVEAAKRAYIVATGGTQDFETDMQAEILLAPYLQTPDHKFPKSQFPNQALTFLRFLSVQTGSTANGDIRFEPALREGQSPAALLQNGFNDIPTPISHAYPDPKLEWEAAWRTRIAPELPEMYRN